MRVGEPTCTSQHSSTTARNYTRRRPTTIRRFSASSAPNRRHTRRTQQPPARHSHRRRDHPWAGGPEVNTSPVIFLANGTRANHAVPQHLRDAPWRKTRFRRRDAARRSAAVEPRRAVSDPPRRRPPSPRASRARRSIPAHSPDTPIRRNRIRRVTGNYAVFVIALWYSRIRSGRYAPCYGSFGGRRRPGASCQEIRPLVGVTDVGGRVCGPCSGDDRNWICDGCGQIDLLIGGRQCLACAVRARVQELLAPLCQAHLRHPPTDN
jgi:hypothetical protein